MRPRKHRRKSPDVRTHESRSSSEQQEFKSVHPPFIDDDAESVLTQRIDYDASIHHPALFGKMHAEVKVDLDAAKDFDPALSHPACVGYTFVEKPPKSPPPPPPSPPDRLTCPPRQYLEHYIFPLLLPALEEMLKEAKAEKCFERKRTKFNALDFLTEHLYKHNPKYKDRNDIIIWDIPFVQEWLKDHPRPPLPLSLLWTEEEATLVIQSFWRGYKVRREDEVANLRLWQREWRQENEDIKDKVDNFWAKQMPEQPAPADENECSPDDAYNDALLADTTEEEAAPVRPASS